jgi:hypothetical protein
LTSPPEADPGAGPTGVGVTGVGVIGVIGVMGVVRLVGTITGEGAEKGPTPTALVAVTMKV